MEPATEKEETPVVVNEPPKNLRQKLAAVALSLGDVKPDGYNTFHKYKYFSDEQLSGAFRSRLADAGIVVVPNAMSSDIKTFQTDKGKHSFLTTMRIQWTFYDTDSDERIIAYTVGQGDDPGDKGANKAMTGAFKYLLIKMFQIGGETSDAEGDESTDARHEDKRTPKAKVEKPKAKVEDVKKGGRQSGASEPQVDQVSRLAAELGIGFDGLLRVIKNQLDVELEMPDDAADQKKMMRSFFENLDAEEIGKIVSALEEAKERQA